MPKPGSVWLEIPENRSWSLQHVEVHEQQSIFPTQFKGHELLVRNYTCDYREGVTVFGRRELNKRCCRRWLPKPLKQTGSTNR